MHARLRFLLRFFQVCALRDAGERGDTARGGGSDLAVPVGRASAVGGAGAGGG